MAQTKHEIQDLLTQAGMSPRHRFGQNFMIDQNLVRIIADEAHIKPGDTILEIGPGTGTLSEELLSRGGAVTAVEIDHDLGDLLAERFADNANFRLIRGDALASKHRLNPDILAAIETARQEKREIKLVANLPYNIASPLIIEMLLAGVDQLVFTVQKEVADRLRAVPYTDAFGVLTVMAQLLSKVEYLRTLPPQAFWPAPSIDSSLLRMTRADRIGDRAGPFHTFIGKLFSARRKTLRKGLTQANYEADEMLRATGVEGQKRPEELSPEQLVQLFEARREKDSPENVIDP